MLGALGGVGGGCQSIITRQIITRQSLPAGIGNTQGFWANTQIAILVKWKCVDDVRIFLDKETTAKSNVWANG